MLKRMRSRYHGRCRNCRKAFAKGDMIFWSRETKALCLDCGRNPKAEPTPEVPQSSEFQGKARSEKGWSRFTVDWPDLKDIARKALRNDVGAFSNPRHKDRAKEYIQGTRRGWSGFTAGQVERWLNDGFPTTAIQGLSEFIPPIREKRRLKFTDEGDEFHLDMAWSGADDYMSEWTKREVIPGVAVEANISFCAGVSEKTISQYLTWLNKAIYSLEASGVDCEISLACVGDGLWHGGRSITTVRVKRENEIADYLSWSAMISPAGWRGLGFLAMLLHCETEGKTASYGLGHGRIPSARTWNINYDKERRVLEINADYDARDFPETDMTNRLREVLKDMRG